VRAYADMTVGIPRETFEGGAVRICTTAPCKLLWRVHLSVHHLQVKSKPPTFFPPPQHSKRRMQRHLFSLVI